MCGWVILGVCVCGWNGFVICCCQFALVFGEQPLNCALISWDSVCACVFCTHAICHSQPAAATGIGVCQTVGNASKHPAMSMHWLSVIPPCVHTHMHAWPPSPCLFPWSLNTAAAFALDNHVLSADHVSALFTVLLYGGDGRAAMMQLR